MIWMPIIFTVLGWIVGSWAGAGIGFAIAWFLIPAVDRYSTPPKLENVGGHVPMLTKWGERQPTEQERQSDGKPITEMWEAQALVSPVGAADLFDGEPHFIVRWRNAKTGETRLMCFQPWSALFVLRAGFIREAVW